MLLLEDGLLWKPPGLELLTHPPRPSSSKTRARQRSQGSNCSENLTWKEAVRCQSRSLWKQLECACTEPMPWSHMAPPEPSHRTGGMVRARGQAQRKLWQLLVNVKESVESIFRC